MRFFQLYESVSQERRIKAPDPHTTIDSWLRQFVGMTGREVHEAMQDIVHERVHDKRHMNDIEKAVMGIIETTAVFLMRHHRRSMHKALEKATAPSWYDKDENRHDEYQEMKKKGADKALLRSHPWGQYLRKAHEEHWSALVASLKSEVTAGDATPDDSQESVNLHNAWQNLMNVATRHPISQWHDRAKRPKEEPGYSEE